MNCQCNQLIGNTCIVNEVAVIMKKPTLGIVSISCLNDNFKHIVYKTCSTLKSIKSWFFYGKE